MTLTIEQADEKIAGLQKQIADAETERAELQDQLTRSFLDGGADSAAVEAKIASIPTRIAALNAAVDVVQGQRRQAERVIAVEEVERVTLENIIAEHERRLALAEVARVEQLLDDARRDAQEKNGRAARASNAVQRQRERALKLGASEADVSATGGVAVERAREQGIVLA